MNNNIIESCRKYMLIGGEAVYPFGLRLYPLTPKAKFNSMGSFSKESHIQSVIKTSPSKTSPSKTSPSKSSPSKTSPSKSSPSNIVIKTPPSHSVARGVRGSPPIDTLFWSFFTILKGEQEYEINHSFQREKEFKIESIEKLRAIKSELKALKLRLTEIENELLNEKKITIKTLVALCLLYKINIMYIWNHKYFEIINNANEKMNIIMNEKGENKISEDISNEKMQYYREKYLCIENINKPLKAITSYTRDELITIVEKLEIKDISAKKTKKEMYEKIMGFIL